MKKMFLRNLGLSLSGGINSGCVSVAAGGQ